MNKRQRFSYWRAYNRWHLSLENEWTARIAKAIVDQVRPFADYALAYGAENALARLEILVNGEPIREVLIRLYRTVFPRSARRMTDMLEQQYVDELREKFFGTTNAVWLDYVVEFINIYVANKVVEITETTKQRIRSKIEQALANGDGIEDVIQELISEEINYPRARRIARTEITGITNSASQAAARETRLLLQKIWISAQDNRTRRLPRDRYDHLHADGQTVPISIPYNINGDLIDFPGDPKGAKANVINCRCTEAYEAIRDNNGRIIRSLSTSVLPPMRNRRIVTI